MSVLGWELLSECGDRGYLLRFDTGGRLSSDEARSRWVPPDRGEIG